MSMTRLFDGRGAAGTWCDSAVCMAEPSCICHEDHVVVCCPAAHFVDMRLSLRAVSEGRSEGRFVNREPTESQAAKRS